MVDRPRTAVAAALAAVLWSGLAKADTVTLSNGDKISGDVVNLVGGKLTIKTAYAGDVAIDWTQVASLATDKALPVVLKDKTQLVGKVVVGEGGKMVSETSIGRSPGFTPADVDAIAPPPPPPFFRYRGNLSLTGRVTDGNTHVKSASGRGEVETRVEQERLSLRAGWDYATDRGVLSQRRAFAGLKLDFFFTEKLYAYAAASFEGDKFKDLDLRSTFGAGLGYQWIDASETSLSTEAGIAYVVEDRREAADGRTLAFRGSWKLTHEIVAPKKVTFFHFGEIFPSVERIDDVFLHTETGIRTALWAGWYTLTEVDFDWDNTPSTGLGRRDVAYILGIGYAFSN